MSAMHTLWHRGYSCLRVRGLNCVLGVQKEKDRRAMPFSRLNSDKKEGIPCGSSDTNARTVVLSLYISIDKRTSMQCDKYTTLALIHHHEKQKDVLGCEPSVPSSMSKEGSLFICEILTSMWPTIGNACWIRGVRNRAGVDNAGPW